MTEAARLHEEWDLGPSARHDKVESHSAQEPPAGSQKRNSNGDNLRDTWSDSRWYYLPHPKRPGYIRFATGDFRRELKRMGYATKPDEGESLSAVDKILSHISRYQHVDRAGPLAGYRCGHVEDERSGQCILVTSEPRLITPEKGSFPTIAKFIEDLLGDQQPHLVAWLSVSLNNLIQFLDKEARYMPGPAIAFCGPRDCGKTLLIEILASLFGRSQSCFHWLMGDTQFNSELIGAELLICDDESGQTDMRVRRSAANKIKASLFSAGVKGEQKGYEAFTCRPWWRIVFACNDEPEDLRVLPLLDDSMSDKLSLFKCFSHEIVMPDASRDERWEQIESELPAFAHYLLNEFEIPEEMRDRRTGAKAYQHPDLVRSLASLGYETKLLELIDEGMEDRLPGTFTAKQVQRYLTEQGSSTCAEAKKLLHYPTACGTYLSRLTTTAPDRVSVAGMSKGIQRYTISRGEME